MAGEAVAGGQGRGSRRHCMPPTTMAPGPSMVGTEEEVSSLRASNFRLPGRSVSGHKAHRAREEGVGLATESL